ncbi:MAG: glycosyltransferase family 4 protein, partial [Candidatus Aquicultor sp.]
MPRIAYLIRKTGGGMQTHIFGLLSELDRSKFEPIVLSPAAPKLFSFLNDLGISTFEVEMADSISPKVDYRSARSVADVLRRVRPDIIHVHGNKAAVVGWMASYMHKVEHMVTTVHNFPSNLNPSSTYYPMARQANKMILNRADRLIAVSSEIRRCLEDEVGIAPRKIDVIPNGIDMNDWEVYRIGDKGAVDSDNKRTGADGKKKLGLPKDAVVLGAVGRLVPFKGHGVLLQSMARVVANHPNAYLVIVGDGPLRGELENQANELGLSDHVKFLGFVDEPGRYMAALDIFVLPSIKEPFGIVILEAMALGLPVVATSGGGVPDIVTDGVSGLLATPEDAGSLADAIEKMLADKDLREKLALNGSQLVNKNFTITSMA